MQPDTVRRTPYDDYTRDPMKADVLVSQRERQVLELMAAGYTNAHIARELRIHEGTVAVHLSHVAQKLAMATRKSRVSRRFCIAVWWVRARHEAGECGDGAVVVPGARLLPRAAQASVARA